MWKYAVQSSLSAARWLLDAGVERLYFKYCSTFDCRPTGNIGPVADALLGELSAEYSLLCPSLPVNGRTVKDGLLYVSGVPLHESHMRSHPLTPMWASSITELMVGQSRWPCFALSADAMAKGAEGVSAALEKARALSPHFYLVPDYYTDGHAEQIADLFGALPLLSGGSGLLGALGKLIHEADPKILGFSSKVPGRALILAGSCSVATLAQVEEFIKNGGTAVRLEPEKLLSGEQTPAHLLEMLPKDEDSVLVYSSEAPEGVLHAREILGPCAASVFEEFFAKLALLAVDSGFSRIIIAGGETSGAVTEALKLGAFEIGESVAPGVPVIAAARVGEFAHHPEIRQLRPQGFF